MHRHPTKVVADEPARVMPAAPEFGGVYITDDVFMRVLRSAEPRAGHRPNVNRKQRSGRTHHRRPKH